MLLMGKSTISTGPFSIATCMILYVSLPEGTNSESRKTGPPIPLLLAYILMVAFLIVMSRFFGYGPLAFMLACPP